MSNNLYMHVMDGLPAYFDEQENMIFFAPPGILVEKLFQTSLEQIRRQQKISREMRSGEAGDLLKMGYFRIRLQDES